MDINDKRLNDYVFPVDPELEKVTRYHETGELLSLVHNQITCLLSDLDVAKVEDPYLRGKVDETLYSIREAMYTWDPGHFLASLKHAEKLAKEEEESKISCCMAL